jgi:two-component system, LytTR family, response regulator
MRCLILDDEPPAREGIRKLLAAHPDVQVVGEAARVDAALRLAELRRPDLILLDVQLRGETGFDFLARATDPLPYIIFVTAHDRYAAEAFRVEAVDYLLKPVEPAALAEALRRVSQRVRPAPRPAIPHPAALQSLGLTLREAEVLFWLAQGKSNPEIAIILENSPETVKKHVQSILSRLRVENRVGAALQASRILGLPPLPNSTLG